jgi:hypothetical protein
MAGQGVDSKSDRDQSHSSLHDDEHSTAVEDISKSARRNGQQKHRQAGGGLDQGDQLRSAGFDGQEPLGAYGLCPSPDKREHLGYPQHAEDAMA